MRIYNGIPNNGINETVRFSKGTALYLIAPDITDEVEIDFFLQIELNSNDNRLLMLKEQFVLDTVLLLPIPQEVQGIEFVKYGAFTTNLRDNLEIWLIESNSTDQILSDIAELREVVEQERNREIIADTAQTLSNVQQNLGLGILTTALSGVTAGISATALPNFTTATALLSANELQLLL